MASFPKRLLESPSGFPDLGPRESLAFERFLDVVRRHYERSGFAPLTTSLIERPEVLTAKAEGEITTQVYGLRLLNPAEGASDEKDLALRYDHTVPLARYVAAHARELAFPFRRYAIGKVFRGERAKDGRYREFIQADIDTIGDTELPSAHDAEMVAVIAGIFTELAIGAFTIRINNRKVLAGLLRSAGASDPARAMRAIDRLEKVGAEATLDALVVLGMPEKPAAALLLDLTTPRSPKETLSYLKEAKLDAEGARGVNELEEVVSAVEALGVSNELYTIDLSIARGLDYYTGTVYETRLNEHADLGSIASGGRYDNLASAYTDHSYPGVGISIGVTRLLLRLIKAGLVETKESTPAPLLITTASPEALPRYLGYAASLRAQGVACEVYLAHKPLDKQLAFAAKKGFRYALIAQEEHLDKGQVVLRNLAQGSQEELAESDLVAAVQRALR